MYTPKLLNMKISRYNVFLPYEDKYVGFNTYRREYIILEPVLYEMYDASCKMGSFEELKEVHIEFYEFLYSKGFLVEESTDELQLVKDLSYRMDNDDSLFELHINPTMNCNFKCWYCYETHIKDSKMNEETIAQTLRFIERVFAEKKQLQRFLLSWFGGEPLLYFNKVVIPILKSAHAMAQEKGIAFSSSMTTNALLLNQDVISNGLQHNLNFYQITLDGNKERHDKVRFISEGRGSYDAIVANIILAARNQVQVLIRINCSVETLPGLHEIAADFYHMEEQDKAFIQFDFHKVWQVGEDIDDPINNARMHYRKLGYKVVSGTFDTVIDSCYGDHRNHATINYNGEVFKCTARDFTTSNSEGLLNEDGAIDWNYKLEKRLNSKFKNKPCLECFLLPLCGGGCTQQAIEHEGVDYCVHDFDENKKKKLIFNRFIESIL
jgi:uncharacterized protein